MGQFWHSAESFTFLMVNYRDFGDHVAGYKAGKGWYTFGMDPFTAYITELCDRKHFSMREASIAAGLSEDGISSMLRRWPVGKPHPDTLNAIARAMGGDLFHMMRLAGYDVPAIPETSIPRLAEFIESVSALPPAQQAVVMDAYLLLLQAQKAANEPQTRVLRESPPDDIGDPGVA
jgi:hypothetical protein